VTIFVKYVFFPRKRSEKQDHIRVCGGGQLKLREQKKLRRYKTIVALKHVGHFQEEGVPLAAGFSETGGAFLVGQLDSAEWRLEPVYEYGLNVFFGNGRVGLVKKFKIEVAGKIIGQTHNVQVSALILRVRIEVKPVQFVFE